MSAFAALTASVTTTDPSSFYPGEVRILRITLSNNSATAIGNTAFDNLLPGTLPNGLKIAGAVNASVCGGTLTAVNGTQQIKLVGATVPPAVTNPVPPAVAADGVCIIDIPVTAGTSDGTAVSYAYDLASGAVTGTEGVTPVSNSGLVSQTFGVRGLAQPKIEKSFGNSTLVLGGAATTLTVTVRNPNPVAIDNFNIADAFPQLGGNAIIKVAAIPNATAVCSSGAAPVFNPVPASGDTTVRGSGSLPLNGFCTFTINVEANQTNGAYTTGIQQNRINRSSDFSTGLGIPAETDATANLTVISPLKVSKAFSNSALSSGENGSFTITLTNEGDTPLNITSFTDSPIDGVGGANATKGLLVTNAISTCGANPTFNNVGFTLTGGSIPAKSGATPGSCTVTVNFTGRVQDLGVPVSYTNEVGEGAVIVSNPAIRSQKASATILVADDLRIVKGVTPTVVAPGNPIRYDIRVENYGAGAINNVTVSDTFTNGQTFLTGTINGVNYTPTVTGAGCGAVSSSSPLGTTAPTAVVVGLTTVPGRASVNVPGSCTISIWAMTSLTENTSTSNVINAGGVCYNNGGGQVCNGSGSVPTDPNNTVPVLAVKKAFAESTPGVSTFAEGTIVRMAITLSNKSVNPLTNVTISDTLQLANAGGGQLRIASPSNAASTCGTPTIDAVAGSTSIAMNGATVPARANNGSGADGTCVLQVDVVGPAGVYPNIATVGGNQTLANGTVRALTPLQTNSATLTYNPALTANKSFNPASVTSGGKSTVTVQLLNSSSLPLTNVSVKDPLPADMVLADPTNAYSTCAGTPVITGAAGANEILLTGASINGGGTCSLLFDVIATGNANWLNRIPPNNITADGGVRNVLPVDATLIHNAATSLTILKSTNPSTLTFPGQVSQLTIDINSGTQGVTNMGVTDYFTTDGTAGAPENGWIITANPMASTTCPGGNVVAVPGSRSVSLSIASLAANTTCSVKVNVTSTVAAGVTNIIPARALHTDQGLTNSAPASTSLATSSNVGIVKKFTPNVVKPGQRSRLRLTFYNPTSQVGTNLSVTDIMPTGVIIPADGGNPTTTCTGGVVTATGGNTLTVSGGTIAAANGLVPGSCQAEIDVEVAAAGSYVNDIPANALSITIGGTVVTNPAPTSDTLLAKAPLSIHKAFSQLTLDAGNPAGFTTGIDNKAPGAVAVLTLRLENTNAAAVPPLVDVLTGVGVTDILPAGLVVAPVPAASTTCAGGLVVADPSATSIRLSGATIAAGSACTVTVNVLSNISGTYTNQIPAGAVTTNEGVVNEEPTRAELIISTPPTVSKQFSPAVIPPNGISRLSIVITNDNAATMTLTSNFDDVLPIAPGQIRVAATPAMSTTCGGAVDATANATFVRLRSGGTIPPGGCTIDVNVTGFAAGVHVNNIPAGALQTNLGNNQQPANAPLTISTRGYISGKVFKDNKLLPNGIFTSGTDTPIANTQIELRSGPTCSGPLLATATTDALGNYIFADLGAAAYSVCQPTQPAGTLNGTTTAGTIVNVAGSTGTPGTASNPTTSSSQIANVVLGDNGAGEISGSINNNFAEIAASTISGKVFKDNNPVPNGTFESGVDTPLPGVTIQLLNAANVVVATTVTDADGNYSFSGLLPGTYSVLQPTQPSGTSNGITTAGPVPNGGTAGTATPQAVTPSRISNIVLPPNTSTLNNNFAEEGHGGATGVVYDAITRQPVSGAVVTIQGPAGFNPALHVIGGVGASTTGTDGLYQFLLNSNAPPGMYTLVVTTYPAGYVPSPSTMLPTCTNTLLVSPTPDPALVQSNVGAPALAVIKQNPGTCPATTSNLGSGSTQFYTTFNLSNTPGPTRSANVGNNHIPLDPVLGGAIVMTKSTPLVNVVRGDLVPYTITATNTLAATLTGINVVDVIPAGFRYRTGSASLNGVPTEPLVNGRSLTWPNQNFTPGERKTLRMMLVVGTGVAEGEFVNRVSSINNITNTQVSNTATATVRVVPDPTFDCSDIIGKVFDDKNANGYQDQGEPGIANVRIATARGLLVTSDQEGRFHVACAAIPNADRGSNFVMKVDERTLPSGYRLTTENPRDVRVTRGKMVKLNFGASVHRVVRLELSGAAFVGDGTELQAPYISELDKLPEQLQTRPTVLRIAYRQGKESKDIAKKRIAAVSERVQRMWKEKRKKGHEESEPLVPLMIETELEGAQ
ncbi:SdrD B-like domain-containing protein [Herminiimonas glaciei]|uniref:SdrD B-like domain-containing protein n=1 Tax=Herminiimonas glaciei TaxID=523788 RepID=A0ABW2IF58_9BURK